ncbi:MAG TPA: bifunctional oligoribonuclease/PAP phosphatase NrnA [Bacteroidales bacterium]|nr:bifunctional oligoribonuclease/PAP phosphatase NrnA [Bacteroidales bacterium]
MDYLQHTDFERIKQLLRQPRKILIASHMNPDGDAIGSALALYGYLTAKGHTVSVMIPDPDPSFLWWMPFHDKLMVYQREADRCLEAIRSAELFFAVDFNTLGRLSTAEEPLRSSSATRILIDHHTLPDAAFSLKISYEDISSTSEIIYDFIDASGDREMISREIAECIYAGIVTDTGSFSYSCNHVRTYEILADLFRRGIDGEHIHRLIYDNYSEHRMRLLGYSINEKLVVLGEFHAAYISLTLGELERFRHQVGDTEDIVNFALSVGGVNLAALFYEREDGIVKVSLRSKGNFAVNGIAREYFNGGGHVNAAGANSTRSLSETVATFLDLLPRYRDQLKDVY